MALNPPQIPGALAAGAGFGGGFAQSLAQALQEASQNAIMQRRMDALQQINQGRNQTREDIVSQQLAAKAQQGYRPVSEWRLLDKQGLLKNVPDTDPDGSPHMLSPQEQQWFMQQTKPQAAGRGGAGKLDPQTKRVMDGRFSYQSMANDYIAGKNAYDKNPDAVSLNGLVSQEMQNKLPNMSSYLAQNNMNQSFQQLNAADQLRFLKAYEFSSQVSGSTRPPSPEIVNEAYQRIPGYSEPKELFARKMHEMNGQIGERIRGVAQDSGDPDTTAHWMKQYTDYYKGFTKVHDVPYDNNGIPNLPQFGSGGGQTVQPPGTTQQGNGGQGQSQSWKNTDFGFDTK